MKNLQLIACILFLVSCMKKETRETATYSIAQFMDNEAVSNSGFSPDNSKLLITSNRSGIYKRVLFTMDGNGDEIYKLFV